jgi:PAS domain S-box-containing protein
MRSLRTFNIIYEVGLFILVVIFTVFLFKFTEYHIKKEYINQQKFDIEKVDLVIKKYISEKYQIFLEFSRSANKRVLIPVLHGYSDIFFLDNNMTVTEVFKKEEGSPIFKGYRFFSNPFVLFIKNIKPGNSAVSRLLRTPEDDSLSIYMAARQGNKYIVARIDLENFIKDFFSLSELNNNILIFSNADGYIMSSSKRSFTPGNLPEGAITDPLLNERYVITTGWSNTLQCNISILAPVSIMFKSIESVKKFFPAMIVFVILIIVIKTFFDMKFIIQPITRFVELFANWDFNSREIEELSYLRRIKEIDSLYRTFQYKSMELATSVEEIKNKEMEMENMRNYLRSIIDSIASAIVTVDSNFIITQVNKSAEAFFAISSRELQGYSFIEKFKELKLSEEILREAIKNKKGFDIKRKISKDGKDMILHISVFPMIEVVENGLAIKMDDVTLIERAEISMMRSQKMDVIANLVGGLSHDFNNILAGIMGSVSILKLRTESTENLNDIRSVYDKYIGYLEQSAEKASFIVNRLLSLSKTKEIQFARVNLKEIISNVVAICKRSFDPSVDIKTEILYGDSFVSGDAGLLEQMLLNLCINGAQAMTIMKEGNKGGTLEISLSLAKTDGFFVKTHPDAALGVDYFRLSVKDNGVGISDDIISGIFDPFFTTRGHDGGSGLGLTMVYNIVHKHGGFIDVYSEKNVGTEFAVYLPGLTTEDALSSSSFIVKKAEGKILVVDDEEIILRISEELLKICGFEVLTANDGESALEIFADNMLDVKAVLLDVFMEGVNGIDVFLKMKELKSDVKVLLTSGFRYDDKIREGIALGAAGFIQKPFTLQRLSEAIFRILDN